MHKRKRAKLRAHGWAVGTAEEFLGLSAAEAAVVELKLALSASLRSRRRAQKLTQAALAKRLRSSQSRVAKMEAGDRSVSLDLLVRSLGVLGATPRDIARALTKPAVAALYIDSRVTSPQVGVGDSPIRLRSARPLVSRGVAHHRRSSGTRTGDRGLEPASGKVGSRRAPARGRPG
jgi:transcriptional regulator with XRE-family HTH domain